MTATGSEPDPLGQRYMSGTRRPDELAGLAEQHLAGRHHAALDALRPYFLTGDLAPFREKIVEWGKRSRGRVRADVVRRRLEAMGYTGSGAHHAPCSRRGEG